MKLLAVTLWLLLLAGAYWLGAQVPSGALPASTRVASFEAALDQRNPLSRSFEVSRFLRDLDAQSVDGTLEAVEAAGFWFDHQEHRLLMAAWVPIDSDAAVDWAFARPGALKDRATRRGPRSPRFSRPHPGADTSCTLSILPTWWRTLHLYMVQGWARSDRRDELVDYLTDQPPSVSRQRATLALANEILRGGPDELIAWVDTIEADPSNAFKRVAFQKSANALAQVDPARAARWVDDHLGRPYALQAPNVVAMHWAERDPAAALDWLVSLPEESNEADRTKTIFTRWLEDDTKSAEAWVRSAVPSREVDPLVRVIIRRGTFDRDPALAMEWAHLIHDPVVRTRVQTSAGRAWFREDQRRLHGVAARERAREPGPGSDPENAHASRTRRRAAVRARSHRALSSADARRRPTSGPRGSPERRRARGRRLIAPDIQEADPSHGSAVVVRGRVLSRVVEIPLQDPACVSQEEHEDHQSARCERDAGDPGEEVPPVHRESSARGVASPLESAFPIAKPSRLMGRLKNRPYSCQRLIGVPPRLNVQM